MVIAIPLANVDMIPSTALLFGFMLVAAIVGGFVARMLHVPRIVGFLLGGVALRQVLKSAAGSVHPEGGLEALNAAAIPLSAVQDLALGMILFTIGNVFEGRRLRATMPRVIRIGLVECSLVAAFVFVTCLIVSVLATKDYTYLELFVLCALLATAAIETAPGATLFVLQEYDAKGPITDTILGLTGFDDLVCIVLFYLVFLLLTAAGCLAAPEALSQHVWLSLSITTLGSAVLGLLCGTLISMIHARVPLAESLLVFFALFVILGAGEDWLLGQAGVSYNFLLTAMVAGGIFANVAVNSEKLLMSLRTVGGPIYAGFFVLAGYNLHIEELGHMGWLGAAYVVSRAAGKFLGCRVGVQWAGAPKRTEGRLGTAMLCQATVVIGLAAFVSQNWEHALAKQFTVVILGSVVLFELIGPLWLKRCTVQGGEVKAITLLSRGGQTRESPDMSRLALRSLLRLFGLTGRQTKATRAAAQVQHIMRTNVQFIHASDTLDEVLHFIERSTYSHFTVVDDESAFVGVIHFSDVREVIYDPAMRDLVTAIDLVDPNSLVVPMDMPLEELLMVFTERNVGVLPVVESATDRHIVGVVEQRDLLRALHLSQLSH